MGPEIPALHATVEQVNQLSLRKHFLSRKAHTSKLNHLLRSICGLHATGAINPYLSLFARLEDFKREQLEHALYQDHSAAKFRCLRKTIFIHDQSMLPIYFAASAREVRSASEKYMHARGFSSDSVRELTKRILELLDGNELSAQELSSELSFEGNLSPLLYYLCDSGLLVRGSPIASWKDKRVRYAIFEEWFPDIDLKALNEFEARVEVVQSYVHAFGPVCDEDVQWWTGFGKRRTEKALAQMQSQLLKIRIEGLQGEYWAHKEDEMSLSNPESEPVEVVNLLPNLDPYPMGYTRRERYLDPEIKPMVFDRAGNITSTITLDGRIIGVWDVEQVGDSEVKLYFFQELQPSVMKEVLSQAERLGKFLTERALDIRICESMQPMTERSMGGIMTPLKGC